ncbi:MAG: FMN-binding negative transcriptional regulator [Myxococcales bacterium]|nr:FMN-binding negative transcriptional regulator [Myxococcales bacterium]
MYRPARFDMPALELCHEFMERESFATLVSAQLTTAGPAEPLASHVPLYLDRDRGERGTLFGHLAAPNPHCAVLEAGSALAVFSGPHAYVSPRWYQRDDLVPTWNYVAVHAYGTPRILQSAEDKSRVLRELSARFEPAAGGWTPDAMPEGRFDAMLKGIVAFELPIERLEGKAKLTQDKARPDFDGAVTALSGSDDQDARATAEWMQRLRRD